MFVSQEPLTTFFRELIPAARAAGYKLVITLLAREADAEEIFRDVERYWSSLYDVTGEHVLFALGAHQAASKISNSGMPERREPVVHANPHAVITGARTVYWPSGSFAWQRTLRHGHEAPSEGLARSHSMEIAGLRAMFGLREHSIPALLFFLLTPDCPTTPSVVLPLSEFGRSTIYGYLKNLIADLEDQFISIQKQRYENADLRHRLDKLSDHEKKWFDWYVDLKAVETIPNAKRAADKILAICSSSPKQQQEKRHCFDLLQVVSKEVGSHASLTSRLQQLIDHAFFHGSPQWITQSNRRDELNARINTVLKQENLAWQQVKMRLELSQGEPRINGNDSMVGWDYFITYSSKDYWYADRLYAELSKTRKVFLDRLCLQPGDIWPIRLRSEQDRARCTVVLLTENTDDAWFANSECIHAIELVRHGHHLIVPLLVGRGARLPYGLEQVHAIRQERSGDFSSTARQITEALYE